MLRKRMNFISQYFSCLLCLAGMVLTMIIGYFYLKLPNSH